MNVYHETQLAWPEGKLKTPHDRRKNGQFKTTLANALSRVEGAVNAFSSKVCPRTQTFRLIQANIAPELGTNL